MKRIEVSNAIHENLMSRKKYWKKKSLRDTIAYLIEIAESFEEEGMEYEFDEKEKAK